MAEIVFDKSLLKRPIHPAIDLLDNVFYFGLTLPVQTTHIVEGLCFITSEKEAFVCNEEELDKRRLRLLYPDVLMPLRWDIEDIKNFLSSSDDSFEPKLILYQLAKELKKYVELSEEEQYYIISLWIIGTYLLPIWKAYPYLSISGSKRTGKTKLLTFLEQVCFNAVQSVDISTSTVYRLIESTRCTLLIDEAAKLESSEKNEAIRNILNAGYKRSGQVFRSDKVSSGRIKPRAFDVFSAKAFVSYRGIEEVTEDRCIQVVMIRSKNPEIINTDIEASDPIWQKLRNALYRFALKYFKEIKEIYENFKDEKLVARERELWKPILTLAKFFSVYKKIYEYVLKEIRKKMLEETLESREAMVLRALSLLVTEDRVYYLTEIKNKIIEMLQEEDEDIPRWLTNKWLGRCLSRTFNIREAVRHGNKVGRRIYPNKIRELCERYGIEYSFVEQKKLDEQDVEQGG